MGSKDDIKRMLQDLEIHNVYATNQFYKDLCNLLKTNVKKFVSDFLRDFMRKNLKGYKKYERLGTNKDQNRRLDGNALFRYEYRSISNLRCIYMVKDVNNNNKIILLKAFNEEKGKQKGKNAYDFNIEIAIKIYETIKKKEENKNG